MILAVLACFLACIGPTLSFAGINAAWFSKGQIFGGMAASAVLGLLCGLALAFAPTPIAGVGAGLLFALMSERLLASLLPHMGARLTAVCLTAAISGAITYVAGLIPLCSILLIYALFGLWDMRKHWNKPKEPLFSADLLVSKRTDTEKEEEKKRLSSLSLAQRPNIYVLFLESFHSREALQALYGVGDEGLTEFLTEQGFTVFENSLSNACWTQHSLQTLLRMAHYDSHAQGMPEAFRHLFANGYDVQLFDTYIYTFKTYTPWASWHNFNIPGWIVWLYSHFLPFFMQSTCLMSITGNIDPFTDKVDYAGVRNAVEQRMHKTYANPQCYIMRFGAIHTHNQYRWDKNSKWPSDYLPAWRKAASDIRDMVSLILRHDPKACIVAMGDHGSHLYENIWREGPDCNAAMLAHGVPPSLVCLDLAGVLVAVRPPDGLPLAQQIVSPCNLFRLVFEYLGGSGPSLIRVPDTTFHHDDKYPRPLVLAREGKPLERWEVARDAEHITQCLTAFQREPDSPEKLLALALALEYSGQIEVAGNLLLTGLKKTGAFDLLGHPLGRILLRQGKTKEILDNLAPGLVLSHNPNFLWVFLQAMAISGSIRGATHLLAQKAPAFGMGDDERLEHHAHLEQLAGQLDQAEKSWRLLTAKPFSQNREYYERQISWLCQHARCLDALGKIPEALALLDNLLENTSYPNHHYDAPLRHAIGLSLRQGDYENSLRRFESALAIMTVPWPETVTLWYVGVLEQQGQVDKAFAVLTEAAQRNANTPWFGAQLGLFLIRRHNVDAKFRQFRKEAYVWLREQGKMLQRLFDEAWYRQRYAGLIPAGMDAQQHFLHYGRLLGLDPSPYLNTIFYCLTQRDIMQTGYDPVWHFMACSPYEARDPCLGFSVPTYLARHREANWPHVNPLLHYLAQNN